MTTSVQSLFSQLSNLDYLVFILISLSSFALIVFSHFRSTRGREFDWLDYLLMGRKLSLPFFTASLVATWYGGIFGVTRISFESGIFNFVTQGFFWYLSYIVFALFMVKSIRSSGAITLADMIGRQYGPKSEKLAALFNLFNVIPVVYLISFGILISSLFAIPFFLSCIIGLIIVVSYTSLGGLRAVVLTDMMQFLIMFIGVGSVFFYSLYQFGGHDFLVTTLPGRYFESRGGHGLGELVAWGLIAFSTLVDPNFYHRVFAASSSKVATKGILISIGFWFVFDIFTTLGGMYARAVIPDADPSNAYLVYALQILPTGVKGLFLGGIAACILSTLDSYLFTASNTLLYDLLPKGLHLKKRNHILSNIFVCLLALGLAVAFEGNIKSVWKTLGSYSAACLLFPVLFFRFGKHKVTDTQFVTSCLLSVLSVTVWKNIDIGYLSSLIDELYIGVLVSASCFVYFSTKGRKPEKQDFSLTKV